MPRNTRRKKSKKTKQVLKEMERQMIGMPFISMHEALSCKSKQRYGTYWQAKFAANEQMQFHRELDLSIYECSFCGGWHLASRK